MLGWCKEQSAGTNSEWVRFHYPLSECLEQVGNTCMATMMSQNNLYICNVPSTRIWYFTSHYSREGLLKSIEVFVLRLVCLRFGLKPRGNPAPSQTNPLRTEPRHCTRTDNSISHSYGQSTYSLFSCLTATGHLGGRVKGSGCLSVEHFWTKVNWSTFHKF